MSVDDVSSDEWFARYLLDTVFLVILALTAVGVSCYLDSGAYLRDWDEGPGVGFVLCAVLCPVLGIVALAFVVYAGIRLFLRPHTFSHVLLRFAFLAAHAVVLMIGFDTASSTAAALVADVRLVAFQEMGADALRPWPAVEARDYPGAPYDGGEGPPEGFSPPSGPLGPMTPGR